MENFGLELLKAAEGLKDKGRQTYLEKFIAVFFNREFHRNKALILGVGDGCLTSRILGHCSELIVEDAARYLIRINRVANVKQSCVRLSFRQIQYSFEQKQLIRTFFRENGYDPEMVESQLETGMLQPLERKEVFNKFLVNNRNLINSLSGEGLLDIIEIDTPYADVSDGIAGSVSQYVILPVSYRPLTEQSSPKVIETTPSFWQYLDDHGIKDAGDPRSYNYVLLNSPNDHLLRIFGEMVKLFSDEFQLADSSTWNLLNRIFFVSRPEYNPASSASQSRGMEMDIVNDSAVRNCLNYASGDIESLRSDVKDVELYSSLLKLCYFEDSLHVDVRDEFLSVVKAFSEACGECKETGLKHLSSSAAEVELFPKRYDGLVSHHSRLRDDVFKKDRERFFDEVDSFFKVMIESVVAIFANSLLSEVVDLRSEISSKRDEYTRKGGLLNTYSVGEKPFREFKAKCVSDMGELLDRVRENLEVDSLGDLDRDRRQFEKASSKLEKSVLSPTFSAICVGMYELGKAGLYYRRKIPDLFSTIEGIRSNATFADMKGCEYGNKLNAALDGLDSLFSDLLDSLSKITVRLEECNSTPIMIQLKMMLVDKIASLSSYVS